jgi:hypothetical protein
MKSIFEALIRYKRTYTFNIEKGRMKHGKCFYLLKTERHEKNTMCLDYEMPTFTKLIREHTATYLICIRDVPVFKLDQPAESSDLFRVFSQLLRQTL